MAKMNEDNERIKRKYFVYLREAKGRDDKTINKIALALTKYEQSTKYKTFKRFHIEDASTFKRELANAKHPRTKKPLSHSTVDSTLRLVKGFIHWLAGQTGYKSRINYADAEYFNNTLKNARIAHAYRPASYPSLKQCDRAFGGMPERSVDQKRDKAAFAFFVMTGGRVKATSTLRLKHINLEEGYVWMDGREVETKLGKTFKSAFYPVDPLYETYLATWISYLFDTELFSPEDPLFPKPKICNVKGSWENLGLSRKPYASSSKLYEVVKAAFSNVQMPAYTPHAFRKTHGLMMTDYCDTVEKMKAWSMNFGHEDMKTTFSSYVSMTEERQMEVMKIIREGVVES